MVKLWYMQLSSAEGAGTWDVNGVTVLSIKEDDKRKDIFNTLSAVSGIYRPPALVELKSNKNFADTLRMDLRWNGAKWVTADE